MAGSTNIASLVVKVNSDTSQAVTGLLGLTNMLGKTGPLALAAVGVAGLIAGIGVVSTHMAADFQTGIDTLITGAGFAKNQYDALSAGIMKTAKATGESTSQLIDGMFNIGSAGFHKTADALLILQNSAEGAKVGGADLGTVTNALTTVMNDYGLKASQSAMATNVLITTVANGKVHMQDLASSLSTVLPTASALKIPLQDVMAAMAAMTSESGDAATSATYLRYTLLNLEAPTAKGAKAMDDAGISSSKLGYLMSHDLGAAFRYIQAQVGQEFPNNAAAYTAAIKEIAGGTRGMQGLLELTSKTGMVNMQSALEKITASMQNGTTSIIGWQLQQQSFNLQIARAKEVVETLMISLGTHLLPVGTALFRFLADNLIPTISNFIKFITGTSQAAEILRPILIAGAAAIAGVLVVAFIAWTAAAAAAAIATIAATWPIIAIGAAIGLLVAGLIWAYNNWGWFRQGVQGALADAQRLIPIIQAVAGFIGTGLSGAINIAVKTFQNLASMISNVLGALGNVKNTVSSVASGVGGAIGNLIPHLATGGVVTHPTVALVGENEPEVVVPLSQLGSASNVMSGLPSGMSRVSGGTSGNVNGQPIQVNLYIGEQRFAALVAAAVPSAVRLATGLRQ
jgi:TP901 family phage tail tape measure protein